MGFTKLFSDIVLSSIWSETETTRIVWITLLAVKGPNHIVKGSVDGLARAANVPIEGCRRALDVLLAPDPNSGDGTDGHRIEKVDGGYYVVNGEKYKQRRDDDDRRDYQREYHRRYRRKQNVNNRKHNVNKVKKINPSDQIRSDTDQKKETSSLKKNLVFTEPTDTEFEAYCQEKQIERSDKIYLWNHWKENNWTNGGKPILDWKRTIVAWKAAGYLPSQKSFKNPDAR